MNRQEAIAAGEDYYLGKACKRGHNSEEGNKRLTGNGGCYACVLASFKDPESSNYKAVRKFQKKNNQTEHRKAYMRAYMKQYWLDHPEKR